MSSSTIHFYGNLAETFGSEHTFRAESLTDCIALMGARFDPVEVKKEISKYAFEIVRGNRDDGSHLDYDTISYNYGGENHFHLIPMAAGAGSKGFFQIILGAVLIVAAAYVPALAPIAWQAGMMGAGMILSGIGTLMAPVPNISDSGYADRQSVAENPSYLFNGAVNVTEQGATIPLCYGEFTCGSVVIGSELNTEDI